MAAMGRPREWIFSSGLKGILTASLRLMSCSVCSLLERGLSVRTKYTEMCKAYLAASFGPVRDLPLLACDGWDLVMRSLAVVE